MLAFSATCAWSAVRNSTNIRNAVRAAAKVFQESETPEPFESAEFLAIKSFADVETRAEALGVAKNFGKREIDTFISLCQERAVKRVPIQYLVGDWDFHHITLLVRPPVLIPRPETEELVELLLADVKQERAHILDVGCGSGAILLASLAARPNWTGVGVDVAKEAIQLSGDNAKLLKMESRAEIVAGRISDVRGRGKFDALVSNPPYIPTKDMASLDAEVKDHEDFRALCGGADGLDVVREIIQGAGDVVKKGGSIWMEVDTSHPKILEKEKFVGIEFVEHFLDLFGNPRFCHWRVS